MARPSAIVTDPATGRRLAFRRTAAQTHGQFVEVDLYFPPYERRRGDHCHPEQEQQVEVLAGVLHARCDGGEQRLEVGEVLIVPAGVPHTLWNAEGAEVHAVSQTYPALRTGELLQTLWALGAGGKLNARGEPNLLRLAVLLQAYGREYRRASLPYGLRPGLLPLLARLGHHLGYRATYP